MFGKKKTVWLTNDPFLQDPCYPHTSPCGRQNYRELNTKMMLVLSFHLAIKIIKPPRNQYHANTS